MYRITVSLFSYNQSSLSFGQISYLALLLCTRLIRSDVHRPPVHHPPLAASAPDAFIRLARGLGDSNSLAKGFASCFPGGKGAEVDELGVYTVIKYISCHENISINTVWLSFYISPSPVFFSCCFPCIFQTACGSTKQWLTPIRPPSTHLNLVRQSFKRLKARMPHCKIQQRIGHFSCFVTAIGKGFL
jgi:hypothetical protein